MPLHRDRCIALRKFEYSETSQILTLFSRDHGLLRLIAKGAHRRTKAGASKFDGGVDLLDLGEAVFTLDARKDLSTLTEWHLTDGHLELRRSLRSMYLAQYAAELIAMLVEEHDPHVELFDRFEQTLSQFATPRLEQAFLAFELELLRETGYLPELGVCISCARPIAGEDAAFFSPSRGGIVCRNCEGSQPDRLSFDPRLLRLLQSILRLPKSNGATQRLPHLTRHQTDPLNRLLSAHIQHTLGRQLRLPAYVLEK